MRVPVLGISLVTKSWDVLASEPGSLADRSKAEDIIDFSVSSPRGGSSYSRIQSEMISPIQHQSSGLMEGCEPLELKGILARGTGREIIATGWLGKNAMRCSKTDPIYVANNVQDWSDFAMYEVIHLARQ